MRRIFLAILILMFASAASAADLFTLNVPVSVSHIHPTVTGIRIRCQLMATDPVTGVRGYFAREKTQDFPLTAGAFTGTAVIVFRTEDFTTTEASRLTSVNGGQCMLYLFASGTYYQPYASSTGPAVAHAPGTPFNSQSNFDIH